MSIKTRCMALIVCVLAFTGCSHLNALAGLEPPKVSLVDMQLAQSSLFEQQFDIKLRVKNPNNKEIPLNGLKFDIYLTGVELGNAQTAKANVIPALGDSVIELKLSTSTFAWLQLAQGMQHKAMEKIDYRIAGTLFSSGLFSRLPFTKSGEIDINKLLPRQKPHR